MHDGTFSFMACCKTSEIFKQNFRHMEPTTDSCSWKKFIEEALNESVYTFCGAVLDLKLIFWTYLLRAHFNVKFKTLGLSKARYVWTSLHSVTDFTGSGEHLDWACVFTHGQLGQSRRRTDGRQEDVGCSFTARQSTEKIVAEVWGRGAHLCCWCGEELHMFFLQSNFFLASWLQLKPAQEKTIRTSGKFTQNPKFKKKKKNAELCRFRPTLVSDSVCVLRKVFRNLRLNSGNIKSMFHSNILV